jgi:hypothetical protein
MPAVATIDLSALPEDQRAAVAAVLHERDALREINRRLEHLVAELNHVVHGKRSEKLGEDERQLAFEDLETGRRPPSPRRRRAGSRGAAAGCRRRVVPRPRAGLLECRKAWSSGRPCPEAPGPSRHFYDPEPRIPQARGE